MICLNSNYAKRKPFPIKTESQKTDTDTYFIFDLFVKKRLKREEKFGTIIDMEKCKKWIAVAVALIFSVLFFTSCTKKKTDDITIVISGEEERIVINGLNWMSAISDDVPICDITIPGTHDSGAYNISSGIASFGIGRAQVLTIDKQLGCGVRAFDIRLGIDDKGQLGIFHGFMDEHLTYESVENSFKTFLSEHPTEMLIMFVNHEDGDFDLVSSKIKEFLSGSDIYFLENRTPTLSEVRGRVVVINRLDYEEGSGIAVKYGWSGGYHGAAVCRDNAVHFHVQDYYGLDADEEYDVKWNYFMDLYRSEDVREGDFYFNFLSCYKDVKLLSYEVPDILGPSKYLNEKLLTEFARLPSGKYGLVMTDHVDADISETVFCKNFSEETFVIEE